MPKFYFTKCEFSYTAWPEIYWGYYILWDIGPYIFEVVW